MARYLILALALFAGSAFAEEPVVPVPSPTPVAASPVAEFAPTKNYLIGFAGPAIFTGGKGSRFTYGGRFGGAPKDADLVGMRSLGFYASTLTESALYGTVSDFQRATMLALELLNQHTFGSDIYFGARAGVALVSVDVTVPNIVDSGTAASFIWGPVLGYEFTLMKNFAIDLDASYLMKSSSTVNFTYLNSVGDPSSTFFVFQAGLNFRW